MQLHKQGFSLVEIMVVMVILGFLATLIVPRINTYMERQRDERARIMLNQLKSSIAMYSADVGHAPTRAEGGLNALINRPRGSTAEKWRHKYYEDIEIPDDPWGNDFVYHSPPSRYKKKYDSYEVYSLGKDSEEAPGNPNVGY